MSDAAQQAGSAAQALQDAATAAGRAPSVHNTQPWRWVSVPQALELWADRSRQLRVADPDGRLLTMSCGAALQHACLALRAAGWEPAVHRLPDPANPNLLAQVTLTGHHDPAAQERRLMQATEQRHTDRRPSADQAPPAQSIDLIRQAAIAEGAALHPLTGDDLDDLAVAAARANEIGLSDPDQREEMAYWIGGRRAARTGVPDEVVPERAPQTDVPGRDFGHPGTLAVGEGHARADVYTILFTPGDAPLDWLRAGEALSACWLKATDLGVAVLPLSSVVEVPATREVLHRMLAGVGQPMLVLRFGMADPDQPPITQTPRLPGERVVREGRFPKP